MSHNPLTETVDQEQSGNTAMSCADCKFCQMLYQCSRFRQPKDIVTGIAAYTDCKSARSTQGLCGPEGKGFVRGFWFANISRQSIPGD